MDAWLSLTFALLVNFFGRATSGETCLVIGLCIVLGALSLSRISTGLGAIGAFFTTGILLMPFGVVLLVAALALPPSFGLNSVWISLAMACLVLLVIVLPLTVLFQKGEYITALIAWTVALLVVGVVLTLEPRIKRSFDDFKIEMENSRLFVQNCTKQEMRK